MPEPILQETDISVTVAAVEVSTTVVMDDGNTLVEVTLAETSVIVAQADVSVTLETEVGMPILIPGPPKGLEPWTQLTAIESPELTPLTAQDKYRYAVGVLFPSNHAGPGYPAVPGIVALKLPLAPYDGYEFSWMDRDNGFSPETCFWIKPATGSTYTIDGFPAGDGLVMDVMDYNNGLAYCALTNSWNMVFARTELVGFGKVLIKGQFQAHLGIPSAAVDGEFWEAVTAGTVLGSTIKVDDVCVFRENKTTVNVIPRITAADEAGAAVAAAVLLAANAAAGLYIPLEQRNANNGVATLGSTGQLVQLVPAANVVETTGKRLVSDAEKATWNGTLAAANAYTDGSLDLKIALTEKNVANGVATTDAGNQLVQTVDAAKITTGTIDIARLPAAAIERLVIVADQAARYALTTATIQLGDVVKQVAPDNSLYYVKDEANLGNAAGYESYSTGTASAAAWTGITGKPQIIVDLTAITPTASDSLWYVAGAWVNRTTAQAKTLLSLVIGTDVQAQNANLQAEADLTGAADKVSYYTAAGTKALTTLNSVGRAIMALAGTTAQYIRGDGTLSTFATDAVAAITTVTQGTLVDGAAVKTTPVDADAIGLVDSTASNILKKVTWASIKATLKTYFDTVYIQQTATIAVAAVTSSAGVITIDLSSTTDVFVYAATENVTSVVYTNYPAAGKMIRKHLRWEQHASTLYTRPAQIGSAAMTAGGGITTAPALGSKEMNGLWAYGTGSVVEVYPGGVFQ